MNIIGLCLNSHDSNWYDGKLHYQAERYTRKKRNVYNGDKQDFYLNHVKKYLLKNDMICALSYTNTGLNKNFYPKEHPLNLLKPYFNDIQKYDDKFINLWDYYLEDNLYYINHHQSHAAYAFISSEYKKADILAIDGGGVGYNALFFDQDGIKHNLSEQLPLGWLWNISCIFTNYPPLETGKLMGLSGYGKYSEKYYLLLEILIDYYNKYGKTYFHGKKLYDEIGYIDPKDVAFTIQEFTLDKIKEIVFPLKSSDNICITGGVAYNGYMNELFTKHYKNVYVPPAVGDEGQSLGNYMHANYILNKKIYIPSAYNGGEYEYKGNEKITLSEVAQAIADGKIIGWYQGKSETGNRALGNRSILADPRNPNIKDIINSRIKLREDFRPFAPSVLEEHYQEYFDTNQPSPFMSRIMPVISDKIPGVTHVDGTARIQTVNKNFNKKFYDLITEFYNITGIPMLLNTSFNCQEPMVETPDDAIKTFEKCGLDILVINDYIIRK